MPSPFVAADCKYNKPLVQAEPETDYIARKIVKKAKITGYEDEAKTQPIGVMIPTVVIERTPIKELVNSHKDEVGVVNIIKRIAKTGDMSLLEQNKPIYGDLSKLPQSDAEIKAKALELENIYKSLPADMTKGLTISEFVKTFGSKELIDYYKAKNVKEEKADEQQ